MASTIKLKNGSGAPTTGDLVQGEPALDLTNKRLYTENASGVVIEVGTNPTALTIGGTALTATATELNVLDGITATTAELNYTDGVTSNIQTQLNTKAPIASPTFTGTTTIPTADINGGTIDGTVIGGTTAAAGSFTTGQFNTSLNVDGTVTADGLTVDGTIDADGTFNPDTSNWTTASFKGTGSYGGGLAFVDGTAGFAQYVLSSGSTYRIGQGSTSTGLTSRFQISNSGDISFYEDTGSSPKFFWDASAEFLGVGTVTPSQTIEARSATQAVMRVRSDAGSITDFGSDATGTYWKNFTAASNTYRWLQDDDTEVMRIDSSGNVGIGTSSPSRNLSVAGAFGVQSTANDGAILMIPLGTENRIYSRAGETGGAGTALPLTVRMGDTERLRIDSSGNLLVGTTATSVWDASAGSSADNGLSLLDSGVLGVSSYQAAAGSGFAAAINRTGTDGNSIIFRKSAVTVGSISVTDTTTAYNTSSDERLKENITDAPAGNIDDIKVRSFDWKVDGSHQEYGMVAQELEAVAPYAVTKGGTEDDMWSVDYSKLVPMLIKEIQDLKAEVAALKGAN